MLARTERSQEMRAEGRSVLAGGVASSWQDAPPCAVWIDYGKGSRIWDVDGFEYSDFHGGFGVGLAGHAHPAIVEAVQDRVTKGTHFAQPTEDAIVVARELSQPLRTAAVALQQLGHRGHDGRLPPDAGGHRAQQGHQGRGQLPRPPRRRAGLGLPGLGGGRPGRGAALGPLQHRRSRTRWLSSPSSCPFGDLEAVERALDDARRRDRRHDRRAGDDEHRADPAASGLPGRPQGAAAQARCLAGVRRGQDRLRAGARWRDRAVRRHPRPRLHREGDGRWSAVRCHRRRPRAHGADRRPHLRAGRHVQRQPADHGGRHVRRCRRC